MDLNNIDYFISLDDLFEKKRIIKNKTKYHRVEFEIQDLFISIFISMFVYIIFLIPNIPNRLQIRRRRYIRRTFIRLINHFHLTHHYL